ncbi:MAG: CHAD domain-containing protein [Euzebyales bacterium]|nr:CHAD domain-containing protein [Euzebyales bacterium]
MTRVRLDTFDGRLRAAGLRLELRQADDLELILAGRGAVRAQLPVTEPPRLAADLPAGPFRARLAPIVDGRALLPLVTAASRETLAIRRDATGAAVVTATVHEGVDVVDGRGLPGWTIEVDELAGYPKSARRVRDLLDGLGLRRLDGDTLDVAAVATGAATAGCARSPTVALDRDAPALAGYQAVLANLTEGMAANWQGTVDDVDPDFLHDLRVAVRRIRSVLAQGKRVLPAEPRRRFGEGFRWLGHITGRARDLDVYVIEWDRYVAPLPADVAAALGPVLDHLGGARPAAHASLAAELEGSRSRRLLAEWRVWLSDPSGGGSPGSEASRALHEVVADRIARAQRRVLDAGRAIGDDTPVEHLHELRKDAKRLRYLLECFGGS